jgi:acyl-CoA thioesterase-1
LSSLLLAVLVTISASTGAAADEGKTIIGFGDSLMAGYGLNQPDSFTVQLQARLKAEGLNIHVINAGVSGDTTTGGKSRLAWTIDGQSKKPDLVILELGANDALRGISPSLTGANLDWMLAQLKQRGIPVLLAGMMAPPNMGSDYGSEFNAIYPDLAKKYGVAFYPFFLDGVAADPSLNQGDGMHPNPKGVKIIVGKIAPYVVKALKGGQASAP